MSGKFMNVKRITIPALTVAIIASQLMGCSCMPKETLVDWLDQGREIVIEIAEPKNIELGTEVTVEWTQLDQLTSQPELRKSMDDIFKIIAQAGSKNGIFYVNTKGEHEGNNTLYNVFSNSLFRSKYWNDNNIRKQVCEITDKVYADIEVEGINYDRAMLAAFNAYFNILNDSEVGYANMDSTITRLEALAGIFKAEYPVSDTLKEDVDFNNAVGADSSNEYAIFASNLSEQSYLDIYSGSLYKKVAEGVISRGELAYILVQKYFADDYNSVDPSRSCYKDVKNGGDIATAERFIENGNHKKGWQAYELTHALQNPDEGCPERMYKALIVAYDKGIITGQNCDWTEGVTKHAFLEMLTNTYLALPTTISAERGTLTGYETNTNTETPSTEVEVETPSTNVEVDSNDVEAGNSSEVDTGNDVETGNSDVESENPNDIGQIIGDSEVPEEPKEEEPQESTTTSETKTKNSFNEEQAAHISDQLGISIEEFNKLTDDEVLDRLLHQKNPTNSGGGSSSSGGSSNNSGGSSSESDMYHSTAPGLELVDPSVDGYM